MGAPSSFLKAMLDNFNTTYYFNKRGDVDCCENEKTGKMEKISSKKLRVRLRSKRRRNT